tara:strand:+ start:172 stop:2019 length:1848 start_codon:yes stop_codon:yes gene_type:complete
MTSIKDLEKELLKLERLLELQEQQSSTSVVEKTRALTISTYKETAADTQTEISFTITSDRAIPADSKMKITGLTGSTTQNATLDNLFKDPKPTWIKTEEANNVIWNPNGTLEMVVGNEIANNTQLDFTIILGTTEKTRLTGKPDQTIEIEITGSDESSIESKTSITEETPAVVEDDAGAGAGAGDGAGDGAGAKENDGAGAKENDGAGAGAGVAVVAEAGAKADAGAPDDAGDDATAKPEANTVLELTKKMNDLNKKIGTLTGEINNLKAERDNYKNDLLNERKSSSTAYSFVYTLNSAKTDLEKTTDARLSLTKQLEDKEALRAGLQTQLTSERAVGMITIGDNTRDSLAKQLADERGNGTVNLYNANNTAQDPASRDSFKKQLDAKEVLRATLDAELTAERAVGTITIGSNTRDSLAKQLANERTNGSVNLYNADNTAQDPALRDSLKKQLDAKEALRAGFETQLTNERDNTHSTGGFTDDSTRNDSLAKQAKDYKDELVKERTNGIIVGTWKKFNDNGTLKTTPEPGETLAKQLSDAITEKETAIKAKNDAEAASAAADSKEIADLKAELADEQSKLKLEKAEHTKTKQDYLKDLKAIDDKITALLSVGSTK